jgi:hypothetical protein
MIRSGRIRKAFRFAFDVGRARLQPDDVPFVQLQFGGVLDGDDTFIRIEKSRDNVEQSGFASTGAAGNQDVHLGLDNSLDHCSHLGGQGATIQNLFYGGTHHHKPPDGEHRPLQGQGRDNGIDPGAIR